ncbi:hypothetical protein [Gulosibacter bifidus]|uniref:Uncharacterized protein n=1 Tax=Gulosibacter bifidus TaxID=272239 RepID=A0ABW5RKE0_9MICO|nr:hypothetical protein [Gulosibacter bifidus]
MVALHSVQLEGVVGVETAAIRHSAGMSKHSAAEPSGMVTNEVVSTGGAYVINDGFDGHVRIAQGAHLNERGVEVIGDEIKD